MSEIPAPFTITTPSTSMQLTAERTGEAAFTVFNTSGGSIVGRALIHQAEGANQAPSAWFTISGERERAMPAEGAEHFTVQVTVPPDVPAGSYLFRFDMVGVEDVNELHVAGPSITVQVPEAVVEDEEQRCRWCIPAAIAAVVLLVIGGVIVFLLTRNGGEETDIEIPNVASLTAQQATGILANACEPAPCFSVATEEREDPDVDSGLVIETDPDAGTLAEPGSEVTLILSTGEAEVEIPEVRGLPQEQAVQTLEAACDPRPCFRVDTQDRADPRVPSGVAIETSPDAGSLAEQGSGVTLIISTGDPGIAIPDVRGMPQEQAIRILEAACNPRPCFNIQIVQVRDHRGTPTVPFGAVLRTEPSAGSFAQPGSDVRVRIATAISQP